MAINKDWKSFLSKVNYKYTYTILFWLLAVCYLWGTREAHAFQVWGLAGLWWLAHKIASTLETAPLSQFESVAWLDVQTKDQFHRNSYTNSW